MRRARPAANHSGGPDLQAVQLHLDVAAPELMNIERVCRFASSSRSRRGGGGRWEEEEEEVTLTLGLLMKSQSQSRSAVTVTDTAKHCPSMP